MILNPTNSSLNEAEKTAVVTVTTADAIGQMVKTTMQVTLMVTPALDTPIECLRTPSKQNPCLGRLGSNFNNLSKKEKSLGAGTKKTSGSLCALPVYFDIKWICVFTHINPSSPLPSKELHVEELKIVKSSIDDPPKLELKDLPSHLEYAFLEGIDKLPAIIAKDLKEDEMVRLLKVLKSRKRAIAWKISDIKGIDPQFCTHKILMEDDSKPVIQHQRRVNPKIHEVIKNEVIKLLDAELIYHISDSPWVSPVHCVPKKGGITVIENDDNELILTRLVTG
ncbi:hypothetical protein Tco_1272539 [Tanacetum coccineum]